MNNTAQPNLDSESPLPQPPRTNDDLDAMLLSSAIDYALARILFRLQVEPRPALHTAKSVQVLNHFGEYR
jgi:hypothetical protein